GGDFVRSAGSITGSTLTLVANQVTGTLTTVLNTAGGNLSVDLATGGSTLGISNTGNLVIFGVGLDVPTGTINITSTGSVGQTAGTVNANLLNIVSANGGVTIGTATITTLTGQNVGSGNFSVSDSGGLALAVVNLVGNVSITTTGGTLDVAGTLNAGGNNVTLTSTGG